MMKTRSFLIVLVIAIFFLSGCPYESSVPLHSPGKAVIDTRFIGKWTLPDESDVEKGFIEVLNFNDHELLVLFIEKKTETPETLNIPEEPFKIDKTRAFTSYVKGVSYLNVQDVNEKPGKKTWNILKYRFSGDMVYLSFVEEDLFIKEIHSSWKLRSFFKKNQDKDGFFDSDDFILVRAD